MTENTSSALRISPATIALGTAALLAVAPVAIAIFSPGDRVDAAASVTNNADRAAGRHDRGFDRQPERAIAARSRQSANWFLLGMALRETGPFRRGRAGIPAGDGAVAAGAKYYTYLGEMLLVQGNEAGAPETERLFRRALELQPGNPASPSIWRR